MEIIKSKQIAFAYTIKTNVTLDVDYEPFFKRLDKLSIKVEYKIGELDSKGKLHYHGILYLDKGFFRKRICLNGYHVKLVELHDRKGWIKYIHKDCKYPDLKKEGEDRDEEYITDEYPPLPKHKLF